MCQTCTTCSSAPLPFARSTAAREARAELSNPSLASSTFSGNPFTARPPYQLSSALGLFTLLAGQANQLPG